MSLDADDAGVFIKSQEALHSMLHDIETYRGTWGLEKKPTKH